MFKDTSIFEGVLEFDTPAGVFQAHHKGSGTYQIYKKIDDLSYLDIFYIQIKHATTQKNVTPKGIWSKIIKHPEYEDYDDIDESCCPYEPHCDCE